MKIINRVIIVFLIIITLRYYAVEYSDVFQKDTLVNLFREFSAELSSLNPIKTQKLTKTIEIYPDSFTINCHKRTEKSTLNPQKIVVPCVRSSYKLKIPHHFVQDIIPFDGGAPFLYRIANNKNLFITKNREQYKEEDFFMSVKIGKKEHYQISQQDNWETILRKFKEKDIAKDATVTSHKQVPTNIGKAIQAVITKEDYKVTLFLIPKDQDMIIIFASNPTTKNEELVLQIINTIESFPS